jgi:AcrR family transcriptional regulator
MNTVPRAEPKLRRSHSERREEAEERMLEAAAKIVAERGLENLTLAECGEAAGYSRGLAAHYFDSKAGLLSAIATHIVSEYSFRYRGDLPNQVGLAAVLDTIAFYIESGRSHPMMLRAFHAVVGSALTQPAVTAAIAELNRNSVAAFAALIRSGMERGEIRKNIDVTAIALLLLSALRGVMTQWLSDPDHIDLEAVKKELLISVRRVLMP